MWSYLFTLIAAKRSQSYALGGHLLDSSGLPLYYGAKRIKEGPISAKGNQVQRD